MYRRSKDIEFLPHSEIDALQTEQFGEHLRYCVANSPYYRELFSSRGIDPARIDMRNIDSLPFTDKEQLAEFNNDFLAVPAKDIVDIVLSSGTSGMPTRMMYSEEDLQRLAYNESVSLSRCGITADDTVMLTCTLDRCFIAGLAYFMGVREVGAGAVRNGHGTMESHMLLIKRMNPSAIVGVPTFLRKLGYYLERHGLDPRSAGIARLVCIGETLRDEKMDMLPLVGELEELWGAKAYSTYASSEIVTSFCECECQQGGHLVPELGVVEIVDSNGKALPPGEVGEVVLTPLGVTGMPLLRFRTGDVSFLMTENCACGRSSPRLGPILGRRKQMLKIKGTSLYPQAIAAALEGIEGVDEYYLEALDSGQSTDELKVHVAVNRGDLTANRIQEILQSLVRIKLDILVESGEIVRGFVFDSAFRKPVRFLDRRKQS